MSNNKNDRTPERDLLEIAAAILNDLEAGRELLREDVRALVLSVAKPGDYWRREYAHMSNLYNVEHRKVTRYMYLTEDDIPGIVSQVASGYAALDEFVEVTCEAIAKHVAGVKRELWPEVPDDQG